MNYTNYECAIVEHHSVALEGWPSNLLPIQNPSCIGGCQQVQFLLNALIEGTCH
ncbi:hypothetical protein EDD22DRAFT_740428, partial [Suillus occidentalis]